MHNRREQSECLFFWHLYSEKRSYKKALTLAVSNFGVVKGVSFANTIEGFLTGLTRFLKILMSWECSAFLDVMYGIFIGSSILENKRFLYLFELLDHAGSISCSKL